MKKDERIRLSYEFLKAKATDGNIFSIDELVEHTGWTQINTRTNISKRLKEFLTQDRSDKTKYKVKRKIFNVTYTDYASLFKQADKLVPDYNEHLHEDVIVFELFLPLTKEDKLRKALEKLFYKDTLFQAYKSIGLDKLNNIFVQKPGETEEKYLEELCSFAGKKFGGYSISHVDGRFRGGPLLTRQEARNLEDSEEEYLFNETTAIVKFIFPIAYTEIVLDTEEEDFPRQLAFDLDDRLNNDRINLEVRKIEWLFRNIFMTNILHTIGQDEIWVLESGKRCQLMRYVAESKDE